MGQGLNLCRATESATETEAVAETCSRRSPAIPAAAMTSTPTAMRRASAKSLTYRRFSRLRLSEPQLFDDHRVWFEPFVTVRSEVTIKPC